MKKRYGYVSNSSTSSFLVYGYDADVKNKREFEHLVQTCKDKVFCYLDGYGTSGDAGNFGFVVTPERLEIMKKHHVSLFDRNYHYNPSVFVVVKEWRGYHKRKTVDKKLAFGHFMNFECDFSSPETDDADDKNFLDWVKFRGEVKKEDLRDAREWRKEKKRMMQEGLL